MPTSPQEAQLSRSARVEQWVNDEAVPSTEHLTIEDDASQNLSDEEEDLDDTSTIVARTVGNGEISGLLSDQDFNNLLEQNQVINILTHASQKLGLEQYDSAVKFFTTAFEKALSLREQDIKRIITYQNVFDLALALLHRGNLDFAERILHLLENGMACERENFLLLTSVAFQQAQIALRKHHYEDALSLCHTAWCSMGCAFKEEASNPSLAKLYHVGIVQLEQRISNISGLHGELAQDYLENTSDTPSGTCFVTRAALISDWVRENGFSEPKDLSTSWCRLSLPVATTTLELEKPVLVLLIFLSSFNVHSLGHIRNCMPYILPMRSQGLWQRDFTSEASLISKCLYPPVTRPSWHRIEPEINREINREIHCVDALKLLLKTSRSSEELSNFKKRLLFSALKHEDLEVIKILMGSEITLKIRGGPQDVFRNGRELYEIGGDWTLLNWACFLKKSRSVAFLLSAGADPLEVTRHRIRDTAIKNSFNALGWTMKDSSRCASGTDCYDIVKALLRTGAKIDDIGCSKNPLEMAIEEDKWDIANLLHANGAKTNERLEDLLRKKLSFVRTDVNKLVDLANAIGVDWSSLSEIHYFGRLYPSLYAKLLKGGLDLNIIEPTSEKKETLIQDAVTRRQWRLVQELAELGADLNTENPEGKTILDLLEQRMIKIKKDKRYYLERGNLDRVIRALEKRGARRGARRGSANLGIWKRIFA